MSEVSFLGFFAVKEYIVNIQFVSGCVIDDVLAHKAVYQQVATEDFNWTTLVNAQAGIELSPQEFRKRKERQGLVIPLDPGYVNKHLRFVFGSSALCGERTEG